MAKKESLTNMKTEQLMEMLGKQREELRTLRFAAAGARPKDSAAPKKTRASIARILTELHTRTADVAEVEAPANESAEATA